MGNRSNQTPRGLSVNQDLIPPKLTKEQRATMTKEEKKQYTASRLVEYRTRYRLLYREEVLGIKPMDSTKERIDALAFYRQYQAEQAKLQV